MYNLTIALAATYVVGSGQWVVHNQDLPLSHQRWLHIIHGEIDPRGFPSGYHHPLGRNGRTIFTLARDPSGVSEAFVEIYDLTTSSYIRKRFASTLFPQHWNLRRVYESLETAFANSQHIRSTNFGNLRQGVAYDIEIEFQLRNGEIRTAYPICKNSVVR